MGADPLATSRRSKMRIIIQLFIIPQICQISISERVLREILSRCNQLIYKAFQALILVYTKLPYCTFYSRHSAYKNYFFSPKMHRKIHTPAHPKKVFNSHGNHHSRIISCTEISAYHLPRYRTSHRENYGRY